MPDTPPSAAAPAGFSQTLKNGLAPLVLTVLQTALVAWFGLQITGKLDLAVKDRQLALDSARTMATLVEKMQSADAPLTEYKGTALKLAMYGEEAIKPLIFMAAAPAPYSEEIPLDGLKLIAVLHKAKVCAALRGALDVEKVLDGARVMGIKQVQKDLQC